MQIGLEAYGFKLSCTCCGRVVLIEETVNGVPHTMSRSVVCWDCLSPERRKEYEARYKDSDAKEILRRDFSGSPVGRS